jgi:hypothetical protein
MISKSRFAVGLAVASLLGACGSDTPDKSADMMMGSSLTPPVDTGTMMPAQAPNMQPSNAGMAGAAPSMKPTMTGSGGAPSMPMTGSGGAPDMMMPDDMKPTLAMDECGLDTKWNGDEYCIKPPPADKGFQIHFGPADYNNPEAKYLLEPGDETNENFSDMTGNTEDVYYLYRQYRMRPGSHHLTIYGGGGGGGFGLGGARLGGTQNLAKDDPTGGVIAPENQGLGIHLAAHTPVSLSLHYINLTEQPILKEFWVNFWYRDKADVKDAAIDMFSMAPIMIAPGQHVLVHGDCPISETGRVIELYGHRHANNLRFSAWHEHGGQKDLVFEDYDWEHPAILEYSSIVENTPPDPAKKVAGGASGILNLAPGDTMSFECDIVNNTDQFFVGQNEAKNDEMCILIGDTVGATVPAFCEYSTTEL